MKCLQPPSSAIFFVTYFYRAMGGGHGLLAPSICYCRLYRFNEQDWNTADWDKGSFTLSASVTVTITNVTLTGKMGMQPILPSQCPSKRSKVPPINVMVTVTESFGMTRP